MSYADFITLLFAFFVVMYAVSTVSDGRYKAVRHALSDAFSPGGPPPAVLPVDGALVAGSAQSALADARALAQRRTQQLALRRLAADQKREQRMTQVADRLLRVVAPLVADGRVSVTRTNRGVAVEINAAVLFDAGAAELRPGSITTLKSLADVLKDLDEAIQIEGHADDQPIASSLYPSNWELSGARAARVARFFVVQGIAPERLGAVGYAEYRPVNANRDLETRARNRRVTLMILAPVPASGAVGDEAG